MRIRLSESARRFIAHLEKCIIIDLEHFSTSYDSSLLKRLREFTLANLTWLIQEAYLRDVVYKSGVASRISMPRDVRTYLVSVVESALHYLPKVCFPGVYVFRINPSNITYGTKKLLNVYRYGFGSFDVQYFGNDLMNVTIEGKTGALIPPPFLISLGITDIRCSIAYIKLLELEIFFRDRTPALLFGFLERFYYGFMSDFSYAMRADEPFNINYRITASLHPNRFWYANALFSGFKGFQMDVNQNLSLLADKPILFYFGS